MMGGMTATMMVCTATDIIPSHPWVAVIDPEISREAIVEATAQPMKMHFIEPSMSDDMNDSTDADAGYGVLIGNYQN